MSVLKVGACEQQSDKELYRSFPKYILSLDFKADIRGRKQTEHAHKDTQVKSTNEAFPLVSKSVFWYWAGVPGSPAYY